jgi:hypothetical protein
MVEDEGSQALSLLVPGRVGEADSADLLAMIAVSYEQDPKGWGYCDGCKLYAYRWLVVVGTHMYSGRGGVEGIAKTSIRLSAISALFSRNPSIQQPAANTWRPTSTIPQLWGLKNDGQSMLAGYVSSKVRLKFLELHPAAATVKMTPTSYITELLQ